MLTQERIDAGKCAVGGSEAAAVVGLHPYMSPYRLYMIKTDQAPPTEEETEAQYFGTVLEEPVARAYMEKTGRKMRRQPLKVHAVHAHMLCEIDYQIVNDPRGPGVYEGKALNAFTKLTGIMDLPDYMFIQAQHNMAVWDYEWAAFGILIGGQRLVRFPDLPDVVRDPATIAMLIDAEREFMRRVELKDPPPVDGMDATSDLIKRLYPQDSGKQVVLDAPELVTTAFDFLRYKGELDMAEEGKAQAANRLKAAIRDASEAIIPGFGRITWKTSKPSQKVVLDEARLRDEFPDVYKQIVTVTTTPGSRRFLPKPDQKEAQ